MSFSLVIGSEAKIWLLTFSKTFPPAHERTRNIRPKQLNELEIFCSFKLLGKVQ